MRLSIRAKQIIGVTAIVGMVVVTLSALYVSRLVDVVLHESLSRGQLMARAVLHHGRVVVEQDAGDPYEALRNDPGIRSILQSSLYGESVQYAAIVDARGVVVAHNDEAQIGQRMPPRVDLATLVREENLLARLQAIYSPPDGQTLEAREQLALNDEAFGSIRIGVSTLLMRRELNASLGPALALGVVALVVGVLVAALLAQLLLRPIHVLRSGLTRLGRGETGVTLDLPEGDEFGELGAFFNSVSRQLSADRTAPLGGQAGPSSPVEHLEDAVALFGASGELLFSNAAMQRVLPGSAVGRPIGQLLPESHPYRTRVELTLATGASQEPSRVTTSDGTGSGAPLPEVRRERELRTHAIAGTDGGLMGVLLVARNTAYLSRVQSTLAYSSKLVALGRLTAGIAHEVKNPLNAMIIHLELLRTKIRSGLGAAVPEPAAVAGGTLGLTRVAPALPPAARDALDHVAVIESEIRRLDEVVQGFLKFTRPEELRLEPVRVSTLFEEILPVVEPEARRHRVRVSVDCSPAVPPVQGDAGMLRQAFLNLAINACQAMPQGGTLRLGCAGASRHQVEVRVEDSGVGIPPEHLSKIFHLYFTTKERGTGLGLSMVYRIVQLHDGEIEVESTPGRGTRFIVRLPQAREV